MADELMNHIKSMIDKNKIVIFMKGTPNLPMCGFSAATIELFNRIGVPYETVNVLENPQIRDGIKAFSNWPTIPQVYVGGKFIGGCDIVHEMDGRGELEPLVKSAVAA
ncbi:MAG: Grx4 family monothiol glutaredoxin [Deltaproteobacteria bacterium]|jgi:monothiol glutaredoxin|nr:Grx4 family monothiol glutaredoxin [Deltaproteobacteria bacterium]MBI3390521.1 Grx4 family monothiol glutaredoxin [Deltaproteobacteria bacterium]